MSPTRVRTVEVLSFLGVEATPLLDRLRAEGLFEAEDLEPQEAEDLRLAALLMQELGVNAAGVEVALHLRRRLFALEARTRALVEVLEAERRKPRRD